MGPSISPTLWSVNIPMPIATGYGNTCFLPPGSHATRARATSGGIISTNRCSNGRCMALYARRASQNLPPAIRCGTYLHPAHHSSRVHLCYPHHPFFEQTGELIRWLRRQTSESLGIKLRDGLELAIPAWLLDPLACGRVHDAPAPCLTVEALLALRDLLDRQPLLHAVPPATPCVSQPEGARDAQESSSAPSVAGPRALHHPHRLATAAHRQAPAVSRAPRPTAHRHQPQGPERGV
jgi:hypothetical protein